MKLFVQSLWLMGLVVACGACSGNKAPVKEDNRIIVEEVTDARGLQRMRTTNSEQTVSFKGKDYHFSIKRAPNDSLPHVKAGGGDTYLDNEILLNITRDGERIFRKVFTKNDFKIITGNEFLRSSVLDGMAFDKAGAQGLVFVVSVSYPQTDLYIPVSVTITADGKMSMAKYEISEDD